MKKHPMHLLFPLILVLVRPALGFSAQLPFEATFPRVTSYCYFQNKNFQITISARTAAIQEEEALFGSPFVWLQSGKKNSSLVQSQQDGPEYRLAGHTEGSICFATPAFAIDTNKVAIFFEEDGRPFQPLMSVVVYDLEKDVIIDQKMAFASITSWETNGSDFFFEELIPRSDVDGGEVEIDGHTLKYTDEDLKAAQRLRLVNNKIAVSSDFLRSWHKWSYIFKSQDDFKLAAGWSEKKQSFENTLVYYAHDKKISCVQFWSRRAKLAELKTRKWNCTF